MLFRSPALIGGHGDIAAGNIYVTPERQQKVDFSDPTTPVLAAPISFPGSLEGLSHGASLLYAKTSGTNGTAIAALAFGLFTGKPADAATGEMAGKIAIQGAVALRYNAFKIPLMRNLVKRAIGGVQEAAWKS